MKLDVEGAVRIVTLDWPEKRNSLTLERLDELVHAVQQADDPQAGCIVLTGNGAFCAGADLGTVRRQGVDVSPTPEDIETTAQTIIRAVVGTSVPVLAAIDGPAIGMGLDIALACDHLLIGPDGWLLQGWGRLGLIPGTGGTLLLTRRSSTAFWPMVADQTRVDGPTAARYGLGQSVAEGSALTEALRLAHRIASLPPSSVRAYVELSREGLRERLPAHLRRSSTIQAALLASPDLVNRVDDLRAALSS